MGSGSPNGAGTPIRAILVDGEAVRAQLKIAHDGIEYVGRLCFESEASSHPEITDHAPLPGRDTEEVLARALRLSEFDLGLRYLRHNLLCELDADCMRGLDCYLAYARKIQEAPRNASVKI